MHQFVESWVEEISEVSTLREFQTVDVQILDTSVTPSYDVDTGTYTYPEGYDPEVYAGQARIIFPRWGTFSGGEAQNNAKTSNTMRLQLGKDALGAVVARGFRVKITAAVKNPSLVGRWATITSDAQGGSSAARTFECGWDGDQSGTD